MGDGVHECVAELEVQRGALDRARSEIELAERVVGPGASALDRIFMLCSVAAIARAEGRHSDVRRAIDEAIGQSSDPDRDVPLWGLFALAARSAADQADSLRAHGPRSEAAAADAQAYDEVEERRDRPEDEHEPLDRMDAETSFLPLRDFASLDDLRGPARRLGA